MGRAVALYSPRYDALTLIAPDGESISVPVDEARELASSILDALGTPEVARQLLTEGVPVT